MTYQVVPLSFWLFPFCSFLFFCYGSTVFFLIFLTVLMIDFGGKHSLLPIVYVYSVLFIICSLPFLSWTCFGYLLILGSPFMWRRSNKKLIGVGVCGIFSFMYGWELDFFGGKPLMSASTNLFSLVPWFLQRENPKISLATGMWQRKRGMVFHYWLYGQSLNAPISRSMPHAFFPLCLVLPTSEDTVIHILETINL